jgi:hypothetical protein
MRSTSSLHVRIREDDQERSRVAAIWSIADTPIKAGTEIALNLTEGLRALLDVIEAGRPFLLRDVDFDLGLVGDVRRRQGIKATMIVPLERDGTVEGVLTFGTDVEGGLRDDHIPFFTGLGKGVETKLLELALGPRPSDHH